MERVGREIDLESRPFAKLSNDVAAEIINQLVQHRMRLEPDAEAYAVKINMTFKELETFESHASELPLEAVMRYAAGLDLSLQISQEEISAEVN